RELSRGMATQMSDDISNVRVAGNPYERVFGAPAQREKIATVFGGGADDFGRIYQLERDMADTAGEVLGGSATARRLQADDAFGSQMGEALNAGAELMTTGATPGFFARQGTKLAD